MILNKYILLIVILIVVGTTGMSGAMRDSVDIKDSVFRSISLTYDFGLTIPHHDDIMYFVEDFIQGIELTYGVVDYKKNNWIRYYNYPEIGIGFSYSTFGNNDVYGSGLALYPYIQLAVFRSKRFYLRNKVSLGLGYETRPFDIYGNPYNSINGSRLNIYIGLGLYSSYKISNNWQLKGKISLNHFSNGLSKAPNHGINTFSLGLGIGYCINRTDELLMKKVKAPRNNSRDVLIVGSFGKSQVSYYDPKLYHSASLNISNIWYRSEKTAWGLGVDIIYSGAAPYLFIEKPDGDYHDSDKFYGSLLGSYNIIMGKTEMFLQLGVYALYSIKPKQPVYPRIGIRQRIVRNLYVNFGLKASFFSAEFIEFGMGYRINYRKNRF